MRPLEPLDTSPPATARRPQHQLPAKPTAGRVPAGLLSLVLHCTCLLLALWLFRFEPIGGAPQGDRSGGIVLVQSRGHQPEYFDNLEPFESQTSRGSQQLSNTQTTSQELSGAAPLTKDLELPGGLPTRDQLLSGSGKAVELPALDGLLTTKNSQQAGDYAVQTGVFGLKGKGTRFVYVFDRSGSMAGFQGRPLASAKAQLLASLADLESTHQFQIVFYADRPSILNLRNQATAQLLFADEATKRVAERWIRGVAANGSTRHLEALLLAVRMRPDVIFFLTDAEEPHLTPVEMEKVNRLNRRVGASIHAIEFGAGPSQTNNNFLVRLAQSNGGQHTYVDVTRLSLQP